MNEPKVRPIPEGMHTVTPHLVCAGAADAIAFYRKAFAAEEIRREDKRVNCFAMPSQRTAHGVSP